MNTPTTQPNTETSNLNGNHSRSTSLPRLPLLSPEPLRPVLSSGEGSRPTVPANAPKPAFSMTDLINRLRDRFGNRLGWSSYYRRPMVDGTPVEETKLEAALTMIGENLPGRASWLRWTYNSKLNLAYENLQRTVSEEESALETARTRAIDTNREVDSKTASLEQERTDATAVDRAADSALDQPIADAHLAASNKVTLAGGSYNAENPDPAAVLRHDRRSMETLAGALGLAWTKDGDSPLLVKWIGWALTVLMAAVFGISFGIMAHAFTIDAMHIKPWYVVGFMAIGLAPAIGLKFGLMYVWSLAGQAAFLPASKFRTVWKITQAFVVTLAALGGDMVVERAGLMARINLENGLAALSHSGRTADQGNQLAFWLAVLILSLGYVTCASVEGWMIGRHRSITNRLLAEQDRLFIEEDAKVRANPVVQEALKAIADVKHLLWTRHTLQARIAATAVPFERKIAEQEARRREVPETLDDHAMMRIQEALDDLSGAQGEFDRALLELMEEAEVAGSWWQRYWRLRRIRSNKRRDQKAERQ